ncbi:MAG: hypothetical protein OM95_00295 [Bdellovibrio sp. ArHS]|uniref:class I SAM-dependent methyltransferase n=1 Tax=Bdellovibrio sp. ArHS TaxID=1569284 RepID=UPI0005824094|nr:class I SAM-dependent methyltransferase [Bdellovibrio sp. ArHS]KHD90004.1 MAG: hypothetical protein OM95_00295 [Bdellovibrio sp. ArHS]
MSETNFLNVTELAGDEVSKDQLFRFFQRYGWAAQYTGGKDVLEAACGTGPGLGYLSSQSKSLTAGDFSETVLSVAKNHYKDRIKLLPFDAQNSPFADASFDVVILFEAIYYLPDAAKFIDECRRILRPEGTLLLATANCSLFDFNPSPHSTKYYTVPELTALLNSKDFSVECFGGSPISRQGLKNKIFSALKKFAVTFNLIPGSMSGKKLLKRLVFGKLVTMPKELTSSELKYKPPVSISASKEDFEHQVLYFKATKKGKQ